MSISNRRLGPWLVLSFSIPLALAACSGDDTAPALDAGHDTGVSAKGGSGGKGGATADAGVGGKAGSTGVGGASAGAGGGANVGGMTGTGGAVTNTGGSTTVDAGPDGSPNAGGTTNTGGSTTVDAGPDGSETGVGGTQNTEAGTGGTTETDSGTDGTTETDASTDGTTETDASTDGTTETDSGGDTGTEDVTVLPAICAGGCARTSTPMADAVNDYFNVSIAATDLTDATVTFRFCAKTGAGGSLGLYVQSHVSGGGYPMFSGASGEGFKNNWSTISCANGMQEVSYTIPATGSNSFVGNSIVAFGLQTMGNYGPTDYVNPTVIYIDSITITNPPQGVTAPGPYTFASDLQAFEVNVNSGGTEGATVDWYDGN